MIPIASYETYQDGQTIFEEGSHGDWIYAIESGSVELSKAAEGGRAVITVLQTGDVFGEIAYLARIPRTATARAVGETMVGLIDRDFLDQEYNKLSQHFQVILRTLSLRLKRATELLVENNIYKVES
ncbi:MAG TPA: cyclic nucleotide-binding domain-containing protein [Syntrophales bacterium]|nr:cyclic nucleotide-binding domain-containing protein [Syntrophales bacterium]